MRKKYRTGPNLFFIEFIIALFFFLIVSTICVRVFVHAHLVTQNAEALSRAQTMAADVLEAVEGTDGSFSSLLAFYPNAQEDGEDFLLFLDREFHFCAPEEAAYTLTLRSAQDGHATKASVSVTDSRQKVIYELSARFYRPLSRKEALS